MYLHWNQNGNQRVWDLSMAGSTRKLRKSLKKNVPRDSLVYERLCRAKNVADLHLAIYPLIGTPEFASFDINSETEWLG
jgi:hypothetical protein